MRVRGACACRVSRARARRFGDGVGEAQIGQAPAADVAEVLRLLRPAGAPVASGEQDQLGHHPRPVALRPHPPAVAQLHLAVGQEQLRRAEAHPRLPPHQAPQLRREAPRGAGGSRRGGQLRIGQGDLRVVGRAGQGVRRVVHQAGHQHGVVQALLDAAGVRRDELQAGHPARRAPVRGGVVVEHLQVELFVDHLALALHLLTDEVELHFPAALAQQRPVGDSLMALQRRDDLLQHLPAFVLRISDSDFGLRPPASPGARGCAGGARRRPRGRTPSTPSRSPRSAAPGRPRPARRGAGRPGRTR